MDEVNSALARDPDHFAGTSTDGPSKMTIYLTGNPASSRLDVASVAQQAETAGIQTEIQYREYSLRELTTLKDSIPDVEPFVSLGDDLLSWGVDPRSNSVRVGVAEVTPDLVDTVRATFGDMVTLERGDRAELMTGRFDNLPNYIGGNRIVVYGQNRCTSGFTITNKLGQKYALTAGHCFTLGAEPVLEGSNHFFGTVQFRRFNEDHARMDMALIGVDWYRGAIWIGGVETQEYRPVHGAANSCTGCQVFFDGSVTGQSLGTIVTAGNSEDCLPFEGVRVCHVVEVRSAGGQVLCQPGDSGGPVFAFDGRGGVTAVGIITAATEDGRTCWYTRIVPILWYWQATITTE